MLNNLMLGIGLTSFGVLSYRQARRQDNRCIRSYNCLKKEQTELEEYLCRSKDLEVVTYGYREALREVEYQIGKLDDWYNHNWFFRAWIPVPRADYEYIDDLTELIPPLSKENSNMLLLGSE